MITVVDFDYKAHFESLERLAKKVRERKKEQERLGREYPRDSNGDRHCTKEKPMPMEFKDNGPWLHKEARETGFETETKVEYKCDSCGHTWWITLGS